MQLPSPGPDLTHAGQLPRGTWHPGTKQLKSGDTGGCVTPPGTRHPSVRRRHRLLACILSLRQKRSSLRTGLSGAAWFPVARSGSCQRAELSTRRTGTVTRAKMGGSSHGSTSTPRPPASELARASRQRPSAPGLPHRGGPEGSRRPLPPEPSLARAQLRGQPPQDPLRGRRDPAPSRSRDAWLSSGH